jgi:hypothetical protein
LLTDLENRSLPTQALADHFLDGATRVFGTGNYFVETIVFDPSFDCVPQAGQSHASLLRTIASSDADVFPICESYAPALDRINDFAEALIRTDYPFETGSRETIGAVVVSNLEGEQRTLGADQYEYDRDAQLLTVTDGAITARDRDLEIRLELPCGIAR